MVAATQLFQPSSNAGVVLAATGVSSSANHNPNGNNSCRVYNDGPAVAFIEFGGSATQAVVGMGVAIPPGTLEGFRSGQAYIAAITAGGLATLYIIPGEGTVTVGRGAGSGAASGAAAAAGVGDSEMLRQLVDLNTFQLAELRLHNQLLQQGFGLTDDLQNMRQELLAVND